ncbi:MAG: hypothetical protein AAF224_13160 [Pseudomonadota bacterium]
MKKALLIGVLLTTSFAGAYVHACPGGHGGNGSWYHAYNSRSTPTTYASTSYAAPYGGAPYRPAYYPAAGALQPDAAPAADNNMNDAIAMARARFVSRFDVKPVDVKPAFYHAAATKTAMVKARALFVSRFDIQPTEEETVSEAEAKKATAEARALFISRFKTRVAPQDVDAAREE